MKNLSETEVLTVFNFTQTMDLKNNEITSYYQLFPRTIGQIVDKYHVKEFHITFTRGSWNDYQWGLNSLPAPSGVEFYAYFDANYDTNENWAGLANALSGVFCASVNYIDRSKSAIPNYSFKPSGSYNLDEEKVELRYGSLPHEGVCTENLTPWIKLLPCQSKMGIAGLLNNYKLFDTNYYSMMAHLIPVCIDSECKQKQLQLTQIISTVFDTKRIGRTRSWSLESLFSRRFNNYCPVSTNSKIKIELKDNVNESNYYRLIRNPTTFEKISNNKKYAVYDLISKDYENSNIGVEIVNENTIQPIQDNVGLEVHRSQSGYAEEYGGFVITIKNNNLDKDLFITYFDIIPWYFSIYVNSFKIENTKVKDYNNEEFIPEFYHEPAIEHLNPAILEIRMIIPKDSITTIKFDFDKKYLLYADYPPDCARGFDVGSAAITIHNVTLGEGYLYPEQNYIRIYTEPMVIISPAPDFSMPYNVITYSCTIIALFFGSMYNAYTRRYIPLVVEKVDKKEDTKETKDESSIAASTKEATSTPTTEEKNQEINI